MGGKIILSDVFLCELINSIQLIIILSIYLLSQIKCPTSGVKSLEISKAIWYCLE
jgi:hypothetical protein